MNCSQPDNINTDNQNSSYAQNPKITERSIDDTVFLVDPDTDVVFYLDSLGTGIWHLLKEPLSIKEAINIVQQAFPEVPSKKIARDVARIINAMSRRNLVLNKA